MRRSLQTTTTEMWCAIGRLPNNLFEVQTTFFSMKILANLLYKRSWMNLEILEIMHTLLHQTLTSCFRKAILKLLQIFLLLCLKRTMMRMSSIILMKKQSLQAASGDLIFLLDGPVIYHKFKYTQGLVVTDWLLPLGYYSELIKRQNNNRVGFWEGFRA